MSPETHPFSSSTVFWFHLLLEAPLVVQGFWYPQSHPFSGTDDATLFAVKLLSALSLGTCLTSFRCCFLPHFAPGKLAVALGLFLYHTTVSIILFRAPRSVYAASGPGPAFESIWGTLHGIAGLWFGLWRVCVWAILPDFSFSFHFYAPSRPLPPPPETSPPSSELEVGFLSKNAQGGSRRRRGRK